MFQGIILCEVIGRLDADPDVLPRTENFGVDYLAFSALCPSCPPDFLRIAFSCVRIDPRGRPTAEALARELEEGAAEARRRRETRLYFEGRLGRIAAGQKRSFEEEEEQSTPTRQPPSAPAPLHLRHQRSSPSEKARFHYRSTHLSAMSVGKEMSLRDPHYRTATAPCNPFLTLPKLREGRKIMGSSRDLFSSCFELPSPARVATPVGGSSTALFESGGTLGGVAATAAELMAAVASMAEGNSSRDSSAAFVCDRDWGKRSSRSLPSSPGSASRRNSLDGSSTPLAPSETISSVKSSAAPSTVAAPSSSSSSSSPHRHQLRPSASTSRFEEHLFQGRVQLLKRLYSGGTWSTQDDSALAEMSRLQNHHHHFPLLRRRGSCESGFFSVGTDTDFFPSDGAAGGLNSARSLGSSLLTVSDLEEDLWAASAFLSGNGGATHHRTSSVFTDDDLDLAALSGDGSSGSGGSKGVDDPAPPSARWAGLVDRGYEKDIRDIVEYFEATCRVGGGDVVYPPLQRHHHHHLRARGGPVIAKDTPGGAAAGGMHRALWLQRRQEQQQQQPTPQLPRSQKIESLIKRVVEKESRERLASRFGGGGMSCQTGGSRSLSSAAAGHSRPLQVCDGIVRSKLAVFDDSKRPGARGLRGGTADGQGLVKSRLAIFDGAPAAPAAASLSTKEMAERRLARILKAQQQVPLLPKEPVVTGAADMPTSSSQQDSAVPVSSKESS